MKRLLLMMAVLGAVVYVGCKQADGDRCQTDDDCESGICSTAKGTCAATGDEMEDIDAAIVIDAAVDAMPDAPDAP